ncbi:divalent-cation tolerance protein CutA [Antribacter sp. KLBMP9083]|uniref:Divalent-cation tolerance protein CutA n=1 Tax=Antribacter soli TaxID=2910976 RepID=A0AA41U588_9MICO|nr:divalent-cation tolerance protein CutA [Antribacter soli]MCF4119758.1 divalent-cation tolerance protein CutA [Antribacter soli]
MEPDDPTQELVRVETTCDSREAARALSRNAVEARLAACGQVEGPIASTYWWKDEVEVSEEWRVVLKTTRARCAELVGHLRESHTYEVPEIVVLAISGGDSAYLDWIRTETRR